MHGSYLKELAVVGFEPTPPERLEPKSSALDHSATLPHAVPILCQPYFPKESHRFLASYSRKPVEIKYREVRAERLQFRVCQRDEIGMMARLQFDIVISTC